MEMREVIWSGFVDHVDAVLYSGEGKIWWVKREVLHFNLHSGTGRHFPKQSLFLIKLFRLESRLDSGQLAWSPSILPFCDTSSI